MRWIGELADFNYTIHYRPGKSNIDADALSRMPSDNMAYMKTYTEIVPPEVLQAVACSAKSQDQGQVNWVSALTRDHTFLPTIPVGTDPSTVPVIDIRQAQATDQVVRRVSDLTQQQERENKSSARRNFSCMNGKTFPSTRMVYLDDIKELELKLLYTSSGALSKRAKWTRQAAIILGGSGSCSS